MNTPLEKGKSRKMTPHEMIENMRAWLDKAECHLNKKQMFGAYKDFRALHRCAYLASNALSKTTVKAAMDWGCAISVLDDKGKHRTWAILGD